MLLPNALLYLFQPEGRYFVTFCAASIARRTSSSGWRAKSSRKRRTPTSSRRRRGSSTRTTSQYSPPRRWVPGSKVLEIQRPFRTGQSRVCPIGFVSIWSSNFFCAEVVSTVEAPALLAEPLYRNSDVWIFLWNSIQSTLALLLNSWSK